MFQRPTQIIFKSNVCLALYTKIKYNKKMYISKNGFNTNEDINKFTYINENIYIFM